MNLEKAKNKFINNLSNGCINCGNFTDVIAAFSTNTNSMTKQHSELLDILKLVKKAMDSESYCEDFDTLYEKVSAAIEKAESIDIKAA